MSASASAINARNGTPTPSWLRNNRASCATGCATFDAKSLSLLELRELREVSLTHACVRVRACMHGFTNRRATRATHATTRVCACFLRNRSRNLRNYTTPYMTEKKSAREVMPETAALVDELRAQFGVEFINGAIAAGQRLKREHAQKVQTIGQSAADAWLARQTAAQGCFSATEAGHAIGVMPGKSGR